MIHLLLDKMFKKKKVKDTYEYKSRINELFPWRISWVSYLLLFVDICAIVCFVVWYSSTSEFRNWFITTSMSTSRHKYLAYTFYSQQEIESVLATNKVISTGKETDVSEITFVKTDTTQGYKNRYEQQVLENPEDLEYKIVEIAEDNWKGWMCVVYEPKKLNLAVCKGWAGDRCTTTAKRYDSPLVVNAGRFARTTDSSIYPAGTVISSNKIINQNENKGVLIGMNKDGVLILSFLSTQEATDAYDLKWACEMGPFLIVNGEKTKFSGNGGYGVHPRTAIGQRKDGIVIILIIDGRQLGSSGVSVVTLADIFEKYGCINAANLDGGGSSTLVVEGQLVNNPQNNGVDFERYVYDAIYLER